MCLSLLSVEPCEKMTVNVTIPHLASNITFVGANLCSIFGTIINATALYVILKGRKVKYHNTSPIIFLQALNALIFCSIFLPLEGVRFYERENTIEVVGSSFCNVWPVFGLSAVGVTYWNLVLIIVNRTLLMLKPNLAKRIFTWKKCIFYTGILWLFFLMYFMIPVNSIWGKPKFLVEVFVCTLTAESKDGTRTALNPLAVFAFIGVIMPIICIFVCFIMIKKAMSAMSQTIDTNLDKDAEQLKKSFSVRTSKQEEAVTRSALIVVGTSIGLNLPFALITVFHPMPPRTSLPGLRMAFYNLFMLASVVNPLIYVFTNDFYKKAFMEVFGLDGSDQEQVILGNETPKGGRETLQRSLSIQKKNICASPFHVNPKPF